MSGYSAAQARFAELRRQAYASSAEELSQILGVDMTIRDWGIRASHGYKVWQGRSPSTRHWDWDAIHAGHTDADRLPLAVYGPGDELWIAGLGLTTAQAVVLRFLEGTPDAACPIRSKRALVALDIATRYAQALDKTELRVQPLNLGLGAFYRDRLGFTLVEPDDGEAYFRRELDR